MSQFATTPNSRAAARAAVLGCFAVLGLAHVLVICLAGFSAPQKTAAAKRELFLSFEPAASVPAAPAPPLPQKTARPAPSAQPAVAAQQGVEALPAETVPLDEIFTPVTADSAAESGAEETGGYSGAASAARPMSEADYLAMIMRRLEEKKVYPLAMRKRGIEGDVSVRFIVKRDGSLGAVAPAANPAHPFLAQAALETVKSASPFPVMEGSAGEFSVQVTIRYQLETANN